MHPFHGLTAVASLKPRSWQTSDTREVTFHGLTAVASLKQRLVISRPIDSRSLPRPNSRGLIEAQQVARSPPPPTPTPFHGLTAVASLKHEDAADLASQP